MLHEEMEGQLTRLGGPSCLAGDIIGDYRVPGGATPGRRIAFLDQAHYSMAKTNTFTGVPLPYNWLWHPQTDDLQQIRQFPYKNFKSPFPSRPLHIRTTHK